MSVAAQPSRSLQKVWWLRALAVLAHPRAASVTVRVEKLDTGSGTVGVEITRDRPAEAASVHQLYNEADPKASG